MINAGRSCELIKICVDRGRVSELKIMAPDIQRQLFLLDGLSVDKVPGDRAAELVLRAFQLLGSVVFSEDVPVQSVFLVRAFVAGIGAAGETAEQHQDSKKADE